MKMEISSTEAVRNFGDCLARIKHRGDVFVITKNNKPVAELSPVSARRFATLGELNELLKRLPRDPGFADDLEKVNASDRIPENPWD
jgi:prevent-host-death family protein